MAQATFAGGCFWCTEAIFQRLKGVTKVTPGYTGGHTRDPNFSNVHYDNTGHAESLQIDFDPNIISYDTLLEVFFATHDPTSLNRQGADVGTLYRSAIFYHDQAQKAAAQSAKSAIPGAVTQIVPFAKFFPAEDYHYNYYNHHREAPYCRLVIDPKIQKLLVTFPSLTKPQNQA
jgi:peptide-methionine (S)-S-oxide reductase